MLLALIQVDAVAMGFAKAKRVGSAILLITEC